VCGYPITETRPQRDTDCESAYGISRSVLVVLLLLAWLYKPVPVQLPSGNARSYEIQAPGSYDYKNLSMQTVYIGFFPWSTKGRVSGSER
jgi:hypothetical protein